VDEVPVAPELQRIVGGALDHDAVLSVLDADGPDALVPPAGSDEAFAAVRRLTTLFADTTIPDLDRALADPMITPTMSISSLSLVSR